jgi:hypothetical protein
MGMPGSASFRSAKKLCNIMQETSPHLHASQRQLDLAPAQHPLKNSIFLAPSSSANVTQRASTEHGALMLS